MLMAARKLQSFGLILLVTAALLAVYPLSLQVASTRSELRQAERDVATTRRRIRMLEGEIAVLANLSQLERWNRDSFGFLAPEAGQYLAGERALANLDTLEQPADLAARERIVATLGPVLRAEAIAARQGGQSDAGADAVPRAIPRRELATQATVTDLERTIAPLREPTSGSATR